MGGVNLWVKSGSIRTPGYPPFTYRGLVEFLVVAEEVLDSLGDDLSARQ